MADAAWLTDSTSLSVALILVTSIALFYLFWNTRKKLLPGPTPWPILGTFPQMAKVGGDNLHTFFQQINETYGPVAQIYFGSYPMVLISRYEDIHDVLVNQSDAVGRPAFIPGIKATTHLRTGILYSNGTHCMESRTSMLSVISHILKGSLYEDLVLEQVQKLVKVFTEKEGTVFQPREHLLLTSFTYHLGAVLGRRYLEDGDTYQKFRQFFFDIVTNDSAFSPYGTIPFLRYIPLINKSYKTYAHGYDSLDSAVRTVLQERKASFDEGRVDFALDAFIVEQRKHEDSSTYSDDKISVSIGDYLIGGVLNSAHTLDWLLLYVAAYPQMQIRCRQEIQKVCGTEGPVTFSHIGELPYVCATVYESQRMGGVVPLTLPYCALRDITVRGYCIPRGAMIVGHLAAVLTEDAQWESPGQFNPERFLDLDGKLTKKPPAFVPFGTGARSCPGYSIAERTIIVVFANLLLSLEFTNNGKVILEGKHKTGVYPASNQIIVKKRK